MDTEETETQQNGPQNSSSLEEQKARLQRIVDEKNRHELDEESRKQVQYIQDLYDSGARIWSKEMFREIEAQLAQKPLPSHITIRSMNGVTTKQRISVRNQDPASESDQCLQLSIWFCEIHSFIENAEERSYIVDLDDCPNQSLPEYGSEESRTLGTRGMSVAWTDHQIPSTEYPVVSKSWNEARENWPQSEACAQLKQILGVRAKLPTGIKRVIGFGLGSIAQDQLYRVSDDGPDGRPLNRVASQHAAALTMASVIGERQGTGPLPVLVQDPAYSSPDKTVLTEGGLEIVGGGGSLAFTYVDEDAVVFTSCSNIPVKQIVADIARPAILICNCIEPVSEKPKEWRVDDRGGELIMVSPWSTDEDSPRTRALVEGYDKFDLFEDEERLNHLEVYVRRD